MCRNNILVISLILLLFSKAFALTEGSGLSLIDGNFKSIDYFVCVSGTCTWTKPSFLSDSSKVYVWCVSGGGGGGSGAKGSTLAGGGGGGSSGAVIDNFFKAQDLPSTVSITIGAGGTGASGISASGTVGQAGTSGNATYFGTVANPCLVSSGCYLSTAGGGGGNGGTLSAGGGGGTASSAGLTWLVRNGGQGGTTNSLGGTTCSAQNSLSPGPGNGGSGAHSTTAQTVSTTVNFGCMLGGKGGMDSTWPSPAYTNGVGQDGAISADKAGSGHEGESVIPTPMPTPTSTPFYGRRVGGGGQGGRGGYGSTYVSGGDGGDGGSPGGGGGGGGGTFTGTSGAGGDGGGGVCLIISIV